MTPLTDPTDAAELFFAGAIAAGVKRVVVCPGSRSTPLAVAAERRADVAVSVHLDERSAAFAALGESKASGLPVAVVCTSGTAATNFAPAVAEAAMSDVPILVISADRPPEHQAWGVGQSLDQRGLFGPHVRDEITMPVGASGGAAFSERAGWRAAATAIERRGPVHVNWPFRLPLEPAEHSPVGSSGLPKVQPPPLSRYPDDLEHFSAALRASRAPVLVAGPNAVDGSRDQAERILAAARHLAIPVFADVLSGLRGDSGLVPMPSMVTDVAETSVDLVIRLGDTPTAKSQRLWWESQTTAQHVVMDPHARWQDPSHAFTTRITSDPAWLFEEAARLVSRAGTGRDDWIKAGQAAWVKVNQVLTDFDVLTEAHIAQTLTSWAADSANDIIVASSSMPIRDIDTFTAVDVDLQVFSNRGVNGIDGVVATAIGIERAAQRRVSVLVGDVAALHDIGSVLDAARRKSELTIVIPNNNGGGIFSHLPIRDALDRSAFNKLFHTPHDTDFSFLGGVDNIDYQVAQCEEELLGALDAPSKAAVKIVEVPVETSDRLRLSTAISETLHTL